MPWWKTICHLPSLSFHTELRREWADLIVQETLAAIKQAPAPALAAAAPVP